MKRIYKSANNTKLLAYKASLTPIQRESEEAYNGFPDKQRVECYENKAGNLRKQLLKDQGYICCYCMREISCNNSKIEHLKSQSGNRNLQLTFSNLYIACDGNEGESGKYQHCDTYKGEKELTYINFNTNIEQHIEFSKQGVVSSKIKDLNDDINDILNLNTKILKEIRQERLATFIMQLTHKYGKSWKKANIQSEIIKYQNKKVDGKYREYCQMFIYYLNKKIKP